MFGKTWLNRLSWNSVYSYRHKNERVFCGLHVSVEISLLQAYQHLQTIWRRRGWVTMHNANWATKNAAGGICVLFIKQIADKGSWFLFLLCGWLGFGKSVSCQGCEAVRARRDAIIAKLDKCERNKCGLRFEDISREDYKKKMINSCLLKQQKECLKNKRRCNELVWFEWYAK